jgi:hypothetical protein
MIRHLLFIALSSGAMLAHAYSGMGVCNHGNETIDSVMCNGPAVLKQTTVKSNMNVTGALHAEGISVAAAMTVLGATEISDSEVDGQVKISGDLSADHVQFKKGVAVDSSNILLNHTSVNGMLIVTSPDKTPYVQVQCGSVVKGAVMFDGKPGVVQVTGDSEVAGKIINGSTEFVKRSCSQ